MANGPITTPRGGVPKRKAVSGTALGAGQPISSRSAFEHSDGEDDGQSNSGARRRLQSEGRRGSGPDAAAAPALRKRMSSSPSVRTNSKGTSSTALRGGERSSQQKRNPRAKAATVDAVEAVAVASDSDGQAVAQRRNQRSLSHQDGLNAEKGSSWVAPAAASTTVVTVPQARSTPSASSNAPVSMKFHIIPQAYGPYRGSTGSQQAWYATAPPSGTSTPQMWRLGSAPLPQATVVGSSYQSQSHLQQPSPGSSAYATGSAVAPPTASSTTLSGSAVGAAPPAAIQGLASWPTAWIPPPSPAPSTSRLSIPQSLKQKPVQVLRGSCSANASPATLHRPVALAHAATPEATWGRVTAPSSRSSLAPPSSPPTQQRLVTQVYAASESGHAPTSHFTVSM